MSEDNGSPFAKRETDIPEFSGKQSLLERLDAASQFGIPDYRDSSLQKEAATAIRELLNGVQRARVAIYKLDRAIAIEYLDTTALSREGQQVKMLDALLTKYQETK